MAKSTGGQTRKSLMSYILSCAPLSIPASWHVAMTCGGEYRHQMLRQKEKVSGRKFNSLGLECITQTATTWIVVDTYSWCLNRQVSVIWVTLTTLCRMLSVRCKVIVLFLSCCFSLFVPLLLLPENISKSFYKSPSFCKTASCQNLVPFLLIASQSALHI